MQHALIYHSLQIRALTACPDPQNGLWPSTDWQDVLITLRLFEKPIPESDVLSGREVLARVSGKTVDWTKPVLYVATNPHLKDLVRPIVPPIVWETKERKGSFARLVLESITVSG